MGLAEGRVLSLLPHLQLRYFEAGEVLREKGLVNPAWLHLLSGVVHANTDTPDLKGVSTGIFGSGTWLGEPSFVTQQAAQSTLVALTPSRVLSIPSELVRKAFEEDLGFSRYVAQMVSIRSIEQAHMLVLMRVASPHLRIFAGLSMLAESFLNGKSNLQLEFSADVLEVPVKQEVLASMFGVSRGTFSECVQHLSRTGWIDLAYVSMSIFQPVAWIKCWETYRQNGWISPNVSVGEILVHMHESLNDQDMERILARTKTVKTRKKQGVKSPSFVTN